MILHRYICCYYHWVSSYVSHLNPNFQNRPDICQEYNINYCASLFWGSFHTTWHILDTSTYLVGTHQLGGEDVNILSRLIPKHQFSGNLWSYHTLTMLPFLLIWKSKSNIKYSPTQNPRFCLKKKLITSLLTGIWTTLQRSRWYREPTSSMVLFGNGSEIFTQKLGDSMIKKKQTSGPK